jgi:hypothetical protein
MKHLMMAAACTALACGSARGADAYNNTTTALNTYHVLLAQGAASSPERGTTVTLAGSDRWVTTAWVRLRIANGGAASFKGRVRLYANDGAGGAPGTPLFDSGPQNAVIDSGADLTYVYRTGGVLLPERATLTYQITERAIWQGSMGPAHYAPPTVGTAEPGVWEHGTDGTWTLIVAAGEPAWGLRLIACYPNCDGSSATPALNVSDFTCFLQKFAGGEAYANCDGSTQAPLLNVSDFTCYLQKFASGCP